MSDYNFWLGAFFRGLAVAGFTFFSVSITQGMCLESLLSGAITGGLVMFTEMIKYYGIDLKDLKVNKKANFLFFN